MFSSVLNETHIKKRKKIDIDLLNTKKLKNSLYEDENHLNHIETKLVENLKNDGLKYEYLNELLQSLESNDFNLIDNIIDKIELEEINTLIQLLPNNYIENLFCFLQKAFSCDIFNVKYSRWLKELFYVKVYTIKNISNMSNLIKLFCDSLDKQNLNLEKCLKMHARLDLLISMLQQVENTKEDNIVVYKDSSSDSEEEDENSTINLKTMINAFNFDNFIDSKEDDNYSDELSDKEA